jgi:hypothetical protein
MLRNLLKSFGCFLLLALHCLAFTASGQELNCKVAIQHGRILNVDPQVFRTMERSITEFLNNRKWTTDEWTANEKLDVNVMIGLTEKTPDDDVYKGTISIQASRPVYNSSYTSPTVNFVDRDVIFRYSQFNPLQFDDNRVAGSDALASNLPAILAFYVYFTLGLDYESFAPNGGSVYFKRAQNVVNNAPEATGQIIGWRAVEGNRNRYWLVDQVLNPRFAAFRTYWYAMHRAALDNMYAQPEESRQKILAGLEQLQQMNKENPSSVLLQFFFNAKSDELIRIMGQATREDRTKYVPMLMAMDVINTRKYEALK